MNSGDQNFNIFDDGDIQLKCDTFQIYEATTDDYYPGLDETITINGNDMVFVRGILVYYGAPADNPFININIGD
jgi:hypothetical protein